MDRKKTTTHLGQRKRSGLDEDELMSIRQQYCDILNIIAFCEIEDEELIPIFLGLRDTAIALIDKLHSMGVDTFLLGMDEEGFFAPTESIIRAKKMKDPEKEFSAIHVSRELKSGSKDTHVIQVDKAITKASEALTESRKKELDRKKKYYSRHRERVLAYQKKYDQEHRVRIHFKNKNYYLLKQEGASRTYNYDPHLASPQEKGVSYHEITEHEKEPQENE